MTERADGRCVSLLSRLSAGRGAVRAAHRRSRGRAVAVRSVRRDLRGLIKCPGYVFPLLAFCLAKIHTIPIAIRRFCAVRWPVAVPLLSRHSVYTPHVLYCRVVCLSFASLSLDAPRRVPSRVGARPLVSLPRACVAWRCGSCVVDGPVSRACGRGGARVCAESERKKFYSLLSLRTEIYFVEERSGKKRRALSGGCDAR